MWVHWEQAGNSGSSFAVWGETGFAGSSKSGINGSSGSGFAGCKLVVVDMAPLVAENLDWPGVGKKLRI